MSLISITQKPEEKNEDTESFKFTSRYINDELDLIQTQEENIVTVSAQLENAINHSESLGKLVKLMREVDKTITQGLSEKRKKEAGMLKTIEEVKSLLSQQKYEDIDRFMRTVHKSSQEKIHLSQEQLNKLRMLMGQINQLYQEAAGFCRLSQLIYGQLSQIYEECEQELQKEMSEEEELSKAGSYTGAGDGKVVKSMSFKNLLGDGANKWFKRY